MSLINSRLKINTGCQIGNNGTFAKEIRYIKYTYNGTIAAGGEVQLPNQSLGTSSMPSIPIMFGNVSDQVSGAAAQGLLVSFFSVQNSTYTLILKNTSSVNAGNGYAITISIMAVSL